MGHLQKMTNKERMELFSLQYERNKEGRRGNSFPYWTEKLDKELTEKGYVMYQFDRGDRDSTESLEEAKRVIDMLRGKGNYGRIICGYNKCVQRIRMFTIYFKPRTGK